MHYILHICSFTNRWWDLQMDEKLRYMNQEDVLSFVFVRHPFDRLESAYFDKIVGNPGYFWKQFAKSIEKKCKHD